MFTTWQSGSSGFAERHVMNLFWIPAAKSNSLRKIECKRQLKPEGYSFEYFHNVIESLFAGWIFWLSWGIVAAKSAISYAFSHVVFSETAMEYKSRDAFSLKNTLISSARDSSSWIQKGRGSASVQ